MKALTVAFLLMPLAVISQKTEFIRGYIITNSNDTLPGLVKNRNSFPYMMLTDIKYKKNENSEAVDFPPDSLTGFNIGGVNYVSKYLSLKKRYFSLK